MEWERAFPGRGNSICGVLHWEELGSSEELEGWWKCRVMRQGTWGGVGYLESYLVALLQALSAGIVSTNTKSLLFGRQHFRYWGQSSEQDSKCLCCFRASEKKK